MSDRAMKEKIARALCREKCAYRGEPPCFEMRDDKGERYPWPNEQCDEPGCQAEAIAVMAVLSPSPDQKDAP